MKVPILLPNIFNHPFTYESDLNLKVGDYVIVPFGKSKITGVVWNEFEKKNNKNFKVKSVIKKLNILPLKKTTIRFLNWFSEYNIIPKGMALKLVLLSGNAIEKFSKGSYENFKFDKKKNSIKLSEEQKKTLKNMNISNQKFRVHVLQGTTGSGKTMVYFEALKEIINKGFQGLILLPEIGLTGEFEKKFFEDSDPNFVFGIGFEVYDGLSVQIKSLRSLKNITNIDGEEWKNKSFELTLNYVLNSLL